MPGTAENGVSELGQALASIRLPGDATSLTAMGENARVEVIDQLLLPGVVRWFEVSNAQQAFDAIKSMQIRGAPAIASLAALGIACELLRTPSSDVASHVSAMADHLINSRPTAVNLAEALGRIRRAAKTAGDAQVVRSAVAACCIEIWEEDIERCRKIGDNGARWLIEQLESSGAIAKGGKIALLTVCNTGGLATSGYGTALGVITSLHTMSRLEHCYFAQTSPYNQGARLTAFELLYLGVPSTMALDTSIASLLSGNAPHRVHAFVAGADRVVANGDTANKLSTAQIAYLCHAVPSQHRPLVVIAAPLTTLDLERTDGSQIEIELRPEIESKTVRGLRYEAGQASREQVTVMFTPPEMRVWTPAFDVTPAKLIDAVVTEVGTATPPSPGAAFELSTFVKQHRGPSA